jgi:hypothetical protein
MRSILTVVLCLHGAIHLLGPAKAFGWGSVTQLRAPISAPIGLLWLLAALLLVMAAGAVALNARWGWYVAFPGLLLSQALIATAWSDAKFGTLANLLIAVLLLLTWWNGRPSG